MSAVFGAAVAQLGGASGIWRNDDRAQAPWHTNAYDWAGRNALWPRSRFDAGLGASDGGGGLRSADFLWDVHAIFSKADSAMGQARPVVSGVTRGANNLPLAGCTVYAFDIGLPIGVQVDEVISDANGYYTVRSVWVNDYVGQKLLVVAYLVGSPDVAGTGILQTPAQP